MLILATEKQDLILGAGSKIYYILLLALEQTHRSMEQNNEPRNKTMSLWSINI